MRLAFIAIICLTNFAMTSFSIRERVALEVKVEAAAANRDAIMDSVVDLWDHLEGNGRGCSSISEASFTH